MNKIYSKPISNRFDGDSARISIMRTTPSQEPFTINIENKNTATEYVALFSAGCTMAELQSIFGITSISNLVNGNVKEVGGAVKVAANCPKIALLQSYLEKNPTAVTKMQISVSSEAQLNCRFSSKRIHPFKDFGIESFAPIEYQEAKDSNQKLINTEVYDFVMGDQNALILELAPTSWINVKFFFGASRDDFEVVTAYELERSRNRI